VIDARFPLASGFLYVAGIGMLLGYGIPLLFFPLRWARWFRWRIPVETELAVYFARCLGCLVDAIIFAALRAAPAPAAHTDVFPLVIAALALVLGVHVWGALRRQQPWTETVEIGLYSLLLAVAIAGYRTLP
jgi:hypothetical protein